MLFQVGPFLMIELVGSVTELKVEPSVVPLATCLNMSVTSGCIVL